MHAKKTLWLSAVLSMVTVITALAAGAVPPTPLPAEEAVEAAEPLCTEAQVAEEEQRLDRASVAAGCKATADCWDGSKVSCSVLGSPATCTGVDSDCSSFQRGYVECNGVRTWCPPCPTVCNCTLQGGGWGILIGGECVLLICMPPGQ